MNKNPNDINVSVHIQFQGNDVDLGEVEQRVAADYLEKTGSALDLGDTRIYVKPEDGAAYYTFGEFAGSVSL